MLRISLGLLLSRGNTHRNNRHSQRLAWSFFPSTFTSTLVAIIFCWQLVLLGVSVSDNTRSGIGIPCNNNIASAELIRRELPQRQKHNIEQIYNLKFHPYDFTFNMTTTTIDEKRRISEVHVWFMVPFLEEKDVEEEKGVGSDNDEPKKKNLKEVKEKMHQSDEINEIVESLKPMLVAITNQKAERQDFRT